ncbi:sigma-70 family RNA polymerase sigma factor [Arenimonas caeni]|jgi:RNA polymerase sigma factor (TIGR02999 family)|uniref:sigma-70 family RNA polymerase sigma factor n=1 Tax=Arenimonas caeni TaxID=2058085 RepID=UPI002A35B78B|nr:sigma-70 family RNA polymerase sigma factor [Arenimonas caeni]MDY0021528.1 sigma-70 family RNA polymerase sigma factor [Arenimonas caeni]
MANDITQLLRQWREGDGSARDRLVAVLYPELRALADRQLRGERSNHTLQPTALVNEAYLRLSGLERMDWQDRGHFVHMAARVMRGILVDHARRRQAAKRDGGLQVTLTGVDLAAPEAGDVDALALDAALARLEQLDPDKARVVELRYFGGLTIEETAEAMASSPATVKRQWQAARAWLFAALADGGDPPDR